MLKGISRDAAHVMKKESRKVLRVWNTDSVEKRSNSRDRYLHVLISEEIDFLKVGFLDVNTGTQSCCCYHQGVSEHVVADKPAPVSSLVLSSSL